MKPSECAIDRRNGQLLQINGADIYFEQFGEGEPLLLLHGFTGSSADWNHLGWDWVKGYQVIVPDLRGHGRSTNPTNEFTHRQAASDIFALLDRLNIREFKGVGMSCGGNVLLHLATIQPARVRSMVLVSATSYYPEQARTFMRQSTADTLTEAEWQVLRGRHTRGDTQIRQLYERARGFATSYDDMNFTPPYLSKISARTLIVQGDSDPFYPVDISVEMHESIPRSNLMILPGAGHGPIFGENTESFIKVARQFLKGDNSQKPVDSGIRETKQ